MTKPFSMSKPIDLVQNHVEQKKSDEGRVLGYYQRLNMAGMDFKGQISTAYGQAGYGTSLAAGIDLGAVLIPFCHAELNISGTVERPAHSILAMQRVAQKVWRTPVSLPLPNSNYGFVEPGSGDKITAIQLLGETHPPFWTTREPLIFSHLQGRTFRENKKIDAAIWAGIGKNFANDETGLSIGVGGAAEVESITTFLRDHEVRHFGPSPYSSKLVEYADEVIVQNLKEKVSIWLMKVTNGQKAATALGDTSSWVDYVDDLGGVVDLGANKATGLGVSELMSRKDIVKALTTVAAELDIEEPIDIATQTFPTKKMGDLARSLFKFAKQIKLLIKNRKHSKPSVLKANVQIQKKNSENMIAYLVRQRQTQSPVNLGAYWTHERIEQTILLHKTRAREAKEILKAMKRVERFDDNPRSTKAATLGQDKANPMCSLDLHSTQRWVEVKAGANLTLPLKILAARGSIMTKEGSKKVAFRYQNFASGRARGQDGAIMMTTQDTAIQYNMRIFKAKDGAAQVRNPFYKAEKETSKKFIGPSSKKTVGVWNAMTYQSILVNWLAEPAGAPHATALPNGSGFSFGTSILAGRFQKYAVECVDLKKASAIAAPVAAGAANPPAQNLAHTDLATPQAQELEKILVEALLVTIEDLRAFMVSSVGIVGQDLDEPETDKANRMTPKQKSKMTTDAVHSEMAIIVEANWGLDQAVNLPMGHGKLKKLSELHEYILASQGQAANMPGLNLKSIRLRYRLKEDEDKSYNLISLGWNVQPAAMAEGKIPFPDDAQEKEARNIFLKMLNINPTLPRWLKFKALGIGLGISVRRISRVGSEGMFDLNVQHFADAYTATSVGGTFKANKLQRKTLTDREEIGVPPVMLFSQ